jgi:hypothetical protein
MNVKNKCLVSFAIAISFIASGCASDTYEVSHGTIANLHNNKPAEATQLYEDFQNGKLSKDSRCKLFCFFFPLNHGPGDPMFCRNPAYELAVFYPAAARHNVLHAHTGSHGVYAWLVPNNEMASYAAHFTFLGSNPPDDFGSLGLNLPSKSQPIDSLNFHKSGIDPANIRIPGSVQLNGQLTIQPGRWLHWNYFYMNMDLESTNGVALNVEYKAHNKLYYEPYAPVFFLAYILSGGHYPTF